MNTFLANALCLSVADVEALIRGRTIVAITHGFINPKQTFALYPDHGLPEELPIEDCYRSNFLSIAKSVYSHLNPSNVLVSFWARCELCQIIESPEQLKNLSKLTIWTEDLLVERLKQRQYVFLAYLRVFKTNQTIEVIKSSKGKFLPLQQPVMIPEPSPILSEEAFSKLRQQLEQLKPPPYPELEDLHNELAQLAESQPMANKLNCQLAKFLGWGDEQFTNQLNPKLAWIETIVELGDRSIEKENCRKSNYQAGTDFENIVRQSLEFLGFTVDEAYKGGAGGLDLFCSKPYPLVGECKAGKSIPDRAVEELDRIGKRHLKDEYMNAVRLIIGSGQPTSQLRESSITSKVSVMNTMSLQRLVRLQAKYPNSVNLLELKDYLNPGQTDDKINEYIEKVLKDIKLRSHLIRLVKTCLENSGTQDAIADTLFGAYAFSNPPQSLKPKELHEVLVELSSPLAGYLGRHKCNDWKSDRFYWLRDLPIDEI